VKEAVDKVDEVVGAKMESENCVFCKIQDNKKKKKKKNTAKEKREEGNNNSPKKSILNQSVVS